MKISKKINVMKSILSILILIILTTGCNRTENKIPAKNNIETETESKEKQLKEKQKQVDSLTAYFIYFIDQLKIALLKGAHEKYPTQLKPSLKPFRYDLSQVKNRNNYAVVNHIFVNTDGNYPSKKGLELFYRLKAYRQNLIEIVLDSQKEIVIENFSDYIDEENLEQQIRAQFNSKKISSKDDQEAILALYKHLTRPNFRKLNGIKKHWILTTFQDSELTTSFANLSELQLCILQSRLVVLNSLKAH